MKVALRVVPSDWTNADDFPQHTTKALIFANKWMAEHGFSEDEVRRAIVRMDPLLTKRLLRSASRHDEALYNQMLREGLRHGDLSYEEVGRNIARFGGVA